MVDKLHAVSPEISALVLPRNTCVVKKLIQSLCLSSLGIDGERIDFQRASRRQAGLAVKTSPSALPLIVAETVQYQEIDAPSCAYSVLPSRLKPS